MTAAERMRSALASPGHGADCACPICSSISAVELVVDTAGVPTTTTEIIATGTGVQHKNVLGLVRDNLDDLNEFGRVAFETRPFATPGGEQSRQIAILTEEHATLLLTYMRNTAVVRDFKKRLVREFFAMKRGPVAALSPAEEMARGLVAAQLMLDQSAARIHQLETQAAADAPKVTYVDVYVTDADLLSFSTVASTNGVKESSLRDLLIAKQWIYKQTDSRWSNSEGRKVERNRYSEKADKKRYFRRVENHDAPRFRGSEVMHTLKITPQGAEAVARLIAKEKAS